MLTCPCCTTWERRGELLAPALHCRGQSTCRADQVSTESLSCLTWWWASKGSCLSFPPNHNLAMLCKEVTRSAKHCSTLASCLMLLLLQCRRELGCSPLARRHWPALGQTRWCIFKPSVLSKPHLSQQTLQERRLEFLPVCLCLAWAWQHPCTPPSQFSQSSCTAHKPPACRHPRWAWTPVHAGWGFSSLAHHFSVNCFPSQEFRLWSLSLCRSHFVFLDLLTFFYPFSFSAGVMGTGHGVHRISMFLFSMAACDTFSFACYLF